MRKKSFYLWICILLVVLLMTPNFVQAYNFDKHNEYLRDVLFGDASVKNKSILNALNDASALAIDQHGSDGQPTLDRLRKEHKIKGLPSSIEKFKVGHGNKHRNYTHKGWTYDYLENDGEDEAHWNDIRRGILLKTVNQSFDFGFLSGKPLVGYSDQCEGLAALIYYVHVLGDHISNEEYHSEYEEIPLIKGRGQYGLIEEVEYYSGLLFTDHTSRTYKSYIAELDAIKDEVGEIYTSPEDLDDPNIYTIYHDYAINTMDCLKEYVPLLISKEKFFQKAFPSGDNR